MKLVFSNISLVLMTLTKRVLANHQRSLLPFKNVALEKLCNKWDAYNSDLLLSAPPLSFGCSTVQQKQ